MDEPNESADSRDYDEEFLDQQYERKYPDGAFLEAVRKCEVASTKNVADEIGCDRSTAYRRLKQLEKRDEIGSETLGGDSKVWTRRI